MTTIAEDSLDQLFRNARTHTAWRQESVPEDLLRHIYELAKWGPTSANGCPARFVFITSDDAKARLRPCLAEANVQKTMAAPVTVIVAYDLEFYTEFEKLWPHSKIRGAFEGKPEAINDYVRRNGSLQGAYFILAARGLGLDCGPMSGFNAEKLDAEFFPDGKWKSNFLINIGYGDSAKLHPRNPRLTFEEACKIL